MLLSPISAHTCRLFLGWLLFAQVSCISVTDRVIPDRTFRYDHDVLLDGPPQATLSVHPDHQGWTVAVAQPLKRHIEFIQSQRQEQHYYYFNPLAFPAGAFACPSSGWGWFWTAFAAVLDPRNQTRHHNALRDFTWESCLMALMIVRTKPEIGSVDSIVEHRSESDSRPVTDGRVTVSWQTSPQDTVLSYPLHEGRALVRLAHIATILRDHTISSSGRRTLQLSAWHQNRLLRQWPIEVTADTLRTSAQAETPVMAPHSRWPREPVFKIVSINMPKITTDPEGSFLRLLVQHGLTAVASDTQQMVVRQEIAKNLDGMIEDTNTMGPGHWKAANTLLLITSDQHNGGWVLSVSCVDIRTRELLARLDVAAGPDDLQSALDVALMRFQRLILSLITKRSG